jgi:hypothetical protein
VSVTEDLTGPATRVEELGPEERRLSDLLDELHAPVSASYYAHHRLGMATVLPDEAPEERGGRHGRAIAAVVALAAAVAIVAGYLTLRETPEAPAAAASAWHLVSSPSGETLAAVACPAAGDCWAVGSTLPGSGSTPSRVGIEHDDGSGWTVATGATPDGGVLDALTCVGAGDCWAVGEISGAGSSQPLIEQYAGQTWKRVTVPTVGPTGQGYFAGLGGVACVTADDCWAVGSNTGVAQQPLVLHYDGMAWSVVAGPAITGAAGGRLSGVACVGADDCWAVGAAGDAPLVERWAGSQWAVTLTPSLGGHVDTWLAGLTCLGPEDCWTAGHSGAGDTLQPFIGHYDGRAWTHVATPHIAAAGGAQLDAVACASADDCWAVGAYPGAGSLLPEIVPMSPGGSPAGGSAPASAAPASAAPASVPPVSAVARAATMPLIEHYAGGTWTVVRPPSGMPSAELIGVSCDAQGGCRAVGTITLARG